MIDKRLANIIVAVVTLTWAANFVVQFIAKEYQPDPAFHAVFMAVVGGALALSRGNNNTKGGGDGEE